MDIRIGIMVPVWGRHRLAAASLEWNRRALERAGAEVVGVVVGSEGAKSKAVAEKAGFEYVEHKNQPLGAKCMAAVPTLQAADCDAVMWLGSDDFISQAYADFVVEKIDEGYQAISHRSCCFYNGNDRVYHARFITGVGATVSTALLDNLRWKMFDPTLTKYLDRSFKELVWDKANPAYVITDCLYKNHIVPILDVKTDENMWSMRAMRKIVKLDHRPANVFLDTHFRGLRKKLERITVTKQTDK